MGYLPIMHDGRVLTDYRSSTLITNNIKEQNKINTNNDLKQYLETHGNVLRKKYDTFYMNKVK
jgi:hypothetical protein